MFHTPMLSQVLQPNKASAGLAHGSTNTPGLEPHTSVLPETIERVEGGLEKTGSDLGRATEVLPGVPCTKVPWTPFLRECCRGPRVSEG